MIISSSSYQVQLTDEICEYVESSLRDALGCHLDLVVAADARLETVRGNREGTATNVVVRVDLRDYGPLVVEARDQNMLAAILRGAADSARAVTQARQQPRDFVPERPPEQSAAYGRYSAAGI